MKSVLKYILLTAVRDRLYIGLLVILAATFGICAILGSTFIVEQSQTTIIYIAGSFRIIFAIGIILFTCFYIRRSFDNKEIEFVLSKAISRNHFILSYLFGFILVALFILIPAILVLFFVKANLEGSFFWLLTILCEIFILISFSLLSSLILKSAISSILATLGFYILARMMAFFVLVVDLPSSATDLNTWQKILDILLKIISFVFPRLDLFAKSDWLIYGITDYKLIILPLIQSVIYVSLMTFMAFFDFSKKQF